MNREYHKGYSQELNREMDALVFGHAGTPLLVFPTSMGKYFEYEDRGMISVLAPKIERGELRLDIVELRTICGALGVDFPAFVRRMEKALRAKE